MHDIDRLRAGMSAQWRQMLAQPWSQAIDAGEFDERLYALYLLETYHRTRHNARCQTMVAARDDFSNLDYTKYCLHHALEEAGHEQMALDDLEAMGYPARAGTLPRPLPATEVFIAYIYYISQFGAPLQRLGYTFWAENSNEYLHGLLDKARRRLGLQPAQMTFFREHAVLDSGHGAEVEEAIARLATTEQEWNDVERGMTVSLQLTGRFLENVFDCYRDVDAPPYREQREFLAARNVPVAAAAS
jgi:pyrroloquinoline quinone (PQQ) biosynthesis protein C